MPKVTGCWKCETQRESWYLNDYVIEIHSPDELTLSVKVEDVCAYCICDLKKYLTEWAEK